MYKRTLRILSCRGSGRFPHRAALNAVERMLLAAAMSSCSALGRLLRQSQTSVRTHRLGPIPSSGCVDPGAGHVDLHVLLLAPCCKWQACRKIDCGCALAIAATATTVFALRLRCPRRL